MSKDYTLAVVHMQPDLFPAAKDKELVADVAKLITKANKRRCPVVFDTMAYSVWDEYVPPHPKLTKLVPKYALHKNASAWMANARNCSVAFLNLCEQRGYRTRVVKVCGIYLSGCVKDFVTRLAEDPNRRIIVALRGCRDFPNGPHNEWQDLKKLPNVEFRE